MLNVDKRQSAPHPLQRGSPQSVFVKGLGSHNNALTKPRASKSEANEEGNAALLVDATPYPA